MIILDEETTGLSPILHSIASIGAVDYESGDEFYVECHIPDGKLIDQRALDVNGFTMAQLKDFTKPSPHDAYFQFVEWAKGRGKLLGGHNVGHFDILFLEELHKTAGIASQNKFPFSYRTVDLHSIAYTKFGEELSHEQICVKLGLEPEVKPHHALFGARSERDALKILLKDLRR